MKQIKSSTQNSSVKTGCVIMASGLSKRFGSNKLLAQFRGKTFVETALELTEGLFDKRLVVTRSPEIIDICENHGVPVLLHQMPNRNEAVALGINEMMDMDACMFCPCDQPLLTRKSIEKLITEFIRSSKSISRLCWEDADGSPVVFDKDYFAELGNLPEKRGGGYLVAKYPENVVRVPVNNPIELWDIDTPEAYEKLISEYE